MMYNIKIFACMLCLLAELAYSQNSKSLTDSTTIVKRRLLWHPIIGSGPETGFLAGIGFLGIVKEADTSRRTSFISGNIALTLKGYSMISTSFRYFTPAERYFFQTDLSYTNMPLYFYGIGKQIDPSKKELYFSKNARVQATVFKRIFDQLFIGIGYQAGYIYDIQAPKNGMLNSAEVYGVRGHFLSGPVATLLYDNRDSQLTTTKGVFVRLSNGTSIKNAGGTFDFNSVTLDARVFVQPFKAKQDVIALQFLGVSTTGEVPFTEMALLGNHSIMRGYYQGQYRENSMMAAQVEYRYQLTNWLGVVGFAGAGSVMHKLNNIDGGLLHSYGGGLRFAMPSVQNINLRIDYGRGKESGNFYIGLMEAF